MWRKSWLRLFLTWTFPILKKSSGWAFFENRPLPETKGSPAQLLQAILEKDWQLNPEDRDMIVMQHLFEIQTKTGLKKSNLQSRQFWSGFCLHRNGKNSRLTIGNCS
ncbi:saccharopine dehydrogenase C-terminal domain-containing protein [Algoriphagus boritolerans]|uniref:saccharopine dehydrogenase C-terminal domain-containing protein n=1 Tax=Algoriphagus boritolerans TaxID=308111 RepID=UPI002FCE24AF